MIETGVIHGRFQVLHNDHLKYLLAGKERCGHLVVGITNPDPTLTAEDPAERLRHRPETNPLNYFERYTMVRNTLTESGLAFRDFSVVPFPINLPHLYEQYVPMDATFFLTIYDEWGRKKRSMFESLGLEIEVLWERSVEAKGLSGEEVRELMIQDGEWESLVPPAVRALMKKWQIPQRIRKLNRPE